MLELFDASVSFGDACLIDGLSLQARAGEITALLGANGAGKSTLFHVLAGSLRPTQGHARLFGRPLSQWSAAEMARVRAVLTQSPSLGFDFCVSDAVMLGRIPHATSAQVDHDIAMATLNAVGLATLGGRSYLSLSGGEKQRVHLARTLAQIWDQPVNRRCLMLDEPTLNLDFTQQRAIMSVARQMADAGATVIVVLHELHLAAQFADQLVLLAHGRLVAKGTAHEVLREDTLARAYGAPARIVLDPQTGMPIVL